MTLEDIVYVLEKYLNQNLVLHREVLPAQVRAYTKFTYTLYFIIDGKKYRFMDVSRIERVTSDAEKLIVTDSIEQQFLYKLLENLHNGSIDEFISDVVNRGTTS